MRKTLRPYYPEQVVAVDIDLTKLQKLDLAEDVYVKEPVEGDFKYSVFGAIIASTMDQSEEFTVMKTPIKFKPLAWEYAPMAHIRSKLGWEKTKEIEALDTKKGLVAGLKACMKAKIIKLKDDQLDLAEEMGLASI